MRQDLKSYLKHNKEYVSGTASYESAVTVLEKYKKDNIFKNAGFEYALNFAKPLPKTHIDIGSGVGWLLQCTAPIFEKVVAIEPSEEALNVSKEVNKNFKNIQYINDFMTEGVKSLRIDSPVLITTATVLNHIKDYSVIEFLATLNNLPNGSVLYFDERYDKNIKFRLWYIRNKAWWIFHLSDWQLFFFNLENSGYSSGIFGIKVGKENVLLQHTGTFFDNFIWKINYIYNLFVKGLKKTISILVK